MKLQNPGLVAFDDIQPGSWEAYSYKIGVGAVMQRQTARNEETTHNMCKIDIVHDTMSPFDGRQTSNSELHRRCPIHELQQPVTPTQQSANVPTARHVKLLVQRPAWVN